MTNKKTSALDRFIENADMPQDNTPVKLRQLRVKYDHTLIHPLKPSADYQCDYYLVNEDDLKMKVKEFVPEVDPDDFYYVSNGFWKNGDKMIQKITGIRKSWGSKLIPVKIIPQI